MLKDINYPAYQIEISRAITSESVKFRNIQKSTQLCRSTFRVCTRQSVWVCMYVGMYVYLRCGITLVKLDYIAVIAVLFTKFLYFFSNYHSRIIFNNK